MSVLPEGEQLRRAIRWISAQRQDDPKAEKNLQKLVNEACLKFDLSPKDTEGLRNFFFHAGETEKP